METAIRNFNKQFAWTPRIVGGGRLKRAPGFVLCGMGGSHLAAGLLAGLKPELNITIHRDYGLPEVSNPKEKLFIASSYSGNTEETLDFAKSAYKKGYAVATISVGGALLEFAAKRNLPHIILPDSGIQPRSALGFSMLALAELVRLRALVRSLHGLQKTLLPASLEKGGHALARGLKGKVPVIYASTRNSAIAYNWKIKFNETGKIPAFYNLFPELNHNEMTGFDVISKTKTLSEKFHFIFLTDSADHPKIQKRMQVCKKLYEARGLPVSAVPFTGKSAFERVFNSLLLADWTALHTSRLYGTEAEQVPMVEEFKRLIA